MADTLASLVPAGHALRLCASYQRLPWSECSFTNSTADRCIMETCRRCLRTVHYDTQASIPQLGPEFILCDICFDEVA